MTRRGQDFVRRLSLVFIQPPKIKACERPTGPERSLDDWRGDIVRSRQDVIGKPGIYLDRSPTGSGKSTADIEAVQRAGRALIVVPTHENGEEIVEDMLKARIDAMKYPARSTAGKQPNCKNNLADVAEQFGLSAVAAVCPSCEQKAECLQLGYLAELAAVKSVAVAVATHARAVFNGFDKLSEGRGDFISVHEDAANTVCPDAALSEVGLQLAKDIVNRVLTDPKWLDWLGQAASRDENGVSVPNERLAETRNQLDNFVRRLAELIDSLLVQLQAAERTQVVTMPAPIAKPTGIESLLLRASLEAKAEFSESPWRLLLAVLTGDLFSLGVIVDERDQPKSE